MKKVTKFESDDGTLFDTEQEALAHDKLEALREWYEENKIYGYYQGCRIDWSEFLEWLIYNKEKMRDILSAVDQERCYVSIGTTA